MLPNKYKESLITHSQLLLKLNYNKDTGLFTWITGKHRESIAGTKKKSGYITITINKRGYSAHRLAWFYVTKEWPKNTIDHEDRIKDHNWFSNLRDVTLLVNCQNIPLSPNNKLKIAGVWYNNRLNAYSSYITYNYIKHELGYNKDFFEACCIRKAAEIRFGRTI